jgi:hypothetical protein
MSLWEYSFTLGGFRKFHSSGETKTNAPSEDEFEKWMSLYGEASPSIKADQ